MGSQCHTNHQVFLPSQGHSWAKYHACRWWYGVGYLNPWSSPSAQLPGVGSGQAMGFPTGEQEKPPKFVKELRPNPTMSL